MCGITGIYAFNEIGRMHMPNIASATQVLESRGPDFQGIDTEHFTALGHRRLSIIDTSPDGHQPMSDESGRYTIVFNGEIYNYKELRKQLTDKGVAFHSSSDTEVLLKLFIHEGEACLEKLNGFFAFGILDKKDNTLFLARDRMGIKPLYYYLDEDKFVFGSELKSLLEFNIPRELDYNSLFLYLQLTYIPAPMTILKGVQKMEPGQKITLKDGELRKTFFYQLPDTKSISHANDYETEKKRLLELFDQSVQKRLISDVPIGAFLSGGIDSSAVVAMASRHVDQLNTFSIGFKENAFFDETSYAQLVADKFQTNHTVFKLSMYDFYEHYQNVLDYMDEPFGDSSALNVYILSKKTREHVTVALSGDGADELLAGYNKYSGEYRLRHPGLIEHTVSGLAPLWKILPQSRNAKWSNQIRQLSRFADGAKLNAKYRYWQWCSFMGEKDSFFLLNKQSRKELDYGAFSDTKELLTSHIHAGGDMNEVLRSDVELVLPNDMLTKVDRMSMANSLEVRVPFLDHEFVNYVSTLSPDFKINRKMKKMILQDAFKDILPSELYKRPKHGFEVPLHKWFKTELRSLIDNDLLSSAFVEQQSIFEVDAINAIKKRLFSNNPGDAPHHVWSLLVFQKWWKNNMI